ncbi:MAG TPA: hypothetical protein DCE63_02555 [Eubacterium sp.]|nr:hypothetical protein [Eubacterium sp.]
MLIKYIIIYIFCTARGKFCVMNKKYFKSGIFKKLFSSYIIIILLLFVSFVAAMLYEAWAISMERQENYYQSAVEKISNSIDVLLMDAYVITSDINSSDVINKYAMQKKDIIKNNVSDAEVMTEIKNYMISRYNINIYDVLLMLNDSDSAFSSFGIYRLDKAADNIQGRGKVHSGKSVNDIYDIGNSEVVFNKEFIIYTQNYNSVYAKGVICVLYDKKSLRDMIDSQITHDIPINIYINDEPAYSYGDVKKPIEYNVSSVFNTGIDYKIEIDSSCFRFNTDYRFWISVVVAGVFCVILIISSLYMSKKFYTPLDNISRIIGINRENAVSETKRNKKSEDKAADLGLLRHTEADSGLDKEYDNIINGIKNLIGENNGYKERMISIKPYAQQGMLHGMLNNSTEPSKLSCMLTDDYKVLQKQYYVIADVNMSYIGSQSADVSYFRKMHRIIEQTADSYTDDETYVVWYDKDDYNVFLIINSDDGNNLDSIYYDIHNSMKERIDNEEYVFTIGVDKVRDDIEQLSLACHNADNSLSNIMTGGRDAVYYYDDDKKYMAGEYYFPSDTQQKLIRYVRENRKEDIGYVLDDIMNVNMKNNSDNLKVIRLMIDELHITTAKVLKNIQQDNVVGFTLEKMEYPATLEEIFTYYKAVYNMACEQYMDMSASRKDTNELNKEIMREIDDNYMNADMSLAYLTDKFGVSNKYITMLCKNTKGMTYIQYIQELRIKKATEYIKDGQHSLEEIAALCGYSNMLTFRRNFKSVMGVNPSEYN